MSVSSLPIPSRCRTVDQALGAAKNEGLSNVLILSETETGLLMINAGDGEPLTAAQCAWLLLKAQSILTSPEPYEPNS
jgi:hypothetical protein